MSYDSDAEWAEFKRLYIKAFKAALKEAKENHSRYVKPSARGFASHHYGIGVAVELTCDWVTANRIEEGK